VDAANSVEAVEIVRADGANVGAGYPELGSVAIRVVSSLVRPD
jgi:hypothetical protein